MKLLRSSLLVLFCSLLAVLNAQNKYEYEDLLPFTKEHPDSLIKKLLSKQLDPRPQLKNLLLAQLYEDKSEYYKTDSIIRYSKNQLSFENDSDLYYELLIVEADQKKITDDFESSIQILYRVLSYALRTKKNPLIVNTYVQIGELYRATEVYNLGLEYLSKAKKVFDSEKNLKTELLAKIFNRKAAIYLEMGVHLDSVEYFSLEAIDIAKSIGDRDLEATSCNELGFLYLNIGNPKSVYYLERAVDIWEGLGFRIYAANARMNLSRYYYYNKDFQKALDILEASLKEVNESEWLWEKGSYYRVISNIYSGMGDFEKAYKYSESAIEQLLQANLKQYNERLAFLTGHLELQIKEEQITQKEAEITEAKFELERQKNQKRNLYITLIGVVLILIILIISYYFINKQKKTLKFQQKEIRKTNRKLNKTITQKEILLKEVNHRVKNNLSVLSNMLFLQQKQLTNEDAKEALQNSQVRISTIALIHESFYQLEDMSEISFDIYLPKLVEYMRMIYWPRDRELKVKISCEGLNLSLSEAIPMAMILNELITNSFKYGLINAKSPELFIKYDPENKVINYEDNGKVKVSKENPQNLGGKLLKLFSQQLEAEIERKKDSPYYHYTIKLKR